VLFFIIANWLNTINNYRLRLLKTIDDNLKTKHKYFWKYIAKKNDHIVTQPKIGDNVITQPQYIVEAFADHFSSIFNSLLFYCYSRQFTFYFLGFLNVPSISDSDTKQAGNSRSQLAEFCRSRRKL
jgi:hypothetical protein